MSRPRALALFSVILALCPLTAQAAETPCPVVNPGFERLGADGPVGWRVHGKWRADRKSPAEGQVAMALDADGSRAWDKLLLAGSVRVARGERLQLAAHYRSPTGGADVGLDFRDALGGHVRWCGVEAKAAAERWTPLVREFTITDELWAAGVRTVGIYLQVTRAGAAVAYDRVRLVRVGGAPLAGPALVPARINPLAERDIAINGGIEDGQGPTPRAWRPIAAPGDAARLTRDARGAHAGQHALRIEAVSRWAAWATEPIPIDPSVALDLECWVKCGQLDMAHFAVHAVLLAADGSAVEDLAGERITRRIDWGSLELAIPAERIPSQAVALEVRLVVRGEAPGPIWLDDLAIRPRAVTAKVTSERTGNLFHVGEPVRLTLEATSHLRARRAPSVRCSVTDFWGNTVWRRDARLGLPPLGSGRLEVELPLKRLGYYEAAFSIDLHGEALGRAKASLALVTPFDERAFADDSPFGCHGFRQEPAGLQMMREGYVKWVRTGFGWSWVERERGKLAWDGLDRKVAAYRKHGIRVLGVLNSTPKWASTWREGMQPGAYRSTHGCYPPRDVADFGRYTREVARRYAGKVDHWEIWNEPNIFFWMGTRQQFADLLRAGHAGCHEGNPGCVVMFDTAGTDMAFYRAMFDLGAGRAFDVLATHDYQLSHPGPPEATTFQDEYFDMRALLADKGRPSVPVWDSEFCWLSRQFKHQKDWQGVGEKAQADYLVRSWVLALAARVERMFWFPFYPYYDNQSLDRHPGSLVREDYTPKPVFVAHRVLAERLAGARFARALPVGDACRCYLFKKGDEEIAVAWAIRSPTGVTLRCSGSKATLYDLMNNPAPHPTRDGKLTVKLTPSPVYITGARGLGAVSPPRQPRPACYARPAWRRVVLDGQLDEWAAGIEPLAVNGRVLFDAASNPLPGPRPSELRARMWWAYDRTQLILGLVADGTAVSRDLALAVSLRKPDGTEFVIRLEPGRPAAPASVRATCRHGAGSCAFEAAVPLDALGGAPADTAWPLRIRLSAPRKGLSIAWPRQGHGLLRRVWRAPDGSYPQVHRKDLGRERSIRAIATVFPKGRAYACEIFASTAEKPAADLDHADWKLVVPRKIGSGAMRDDVRIRARHLRTRLTNLVADSSFEAMDVPPPTIGDATRLIGRPGRWERDKAGCTIDASVAHTGTKSARVAATGRSAKDRWSNWGQLFAVKGDTDYAISAYIKVGKLLDDRCRPNIGLHGYPADGYQQLNNQHVPVPDLTSAGWQRVVARIHTHPDVTRLRVWCDVAFDGTAWFDDVHAIEGALPTDVAEIVEQRVE